MHVRYMSTFTLTCFLLMEGMDNDSLASWSVPRLWSLGFGDVNSQTLIHLNHGSLSDSTSLILTGLVANVPQILLSFLYFSYNGLYTCMLLAEEWSAYAHKRRYLRVTSPTGGQRSTYRLQLPYRYGIPLLVGSGTLHWLVSQSIFLARVNVLDSTGAEVPNASISTCGYSPIAIICVIVFGFLVVLVGVANGFRKTKGGMPLAGSCSAAISAACHAPDADASSKRLMWGVVINDNANSSSRSVGHCSFTSLEVEAPIVGNRYAGQ